GPGLATTSAQHEPAGREFVQRVLERAEVAAHEVVERPPGRPGGPDPAPQHRRPGAFLGLGEQREQDRHLGPVIEVIGEDGERGPAGNLSGPIRSLCRTRNVAGQRISLRECPPPPPPPPLNFLMRKPYATEPFTKVPDSGSTTQPPGRWPSKSSRKPSSRCAA